MTSSQPQQPVGGRLADRLSALRAGTGTARPLAVSMLRRLDRYDRAALPVGGRKCACRCWTSR